MDAPVLLCTDGSELSMAALGAGLQLLKHLDGTRVVVSVAHQRNSAEMKGLARAGSVALPAEFEETSAGVEAESVEAIAATQQRLDLVGSATRLLVGQPGPMICDLAVEVGAAAIVVGCRGHGGFTRAVMGSVSDYVVRNARCPVVVTSHPSAT